MGPTSTRGACTTCTNNTFANGCYSCNPANQTVCFACKPGFYQTSNGNCLSVNAQSNTTPVASAVIMKLLSMVALVLAFLF